MEQHNNSDVEIVARVRCPRKFSLRQVLELQATDKGEILPNMEVSCDQDCSGPFTSELKIPRMGIFGSSSIENCPKSFSVIQAKS